MSDFDADVPYNVDLAYDADPLVYDADLPYNADMPYDGGT